MWSITSYYNPAHYKRRLPNYQRFRENLATPLATVELSYDGTFELEKNDADILISDRRRCRALAEGKASQPCR